MAIPRESSTLEDVVEEIVGDVADEHDPRAASAFRGVDGSWSVSGSLRPDEASRYCGLDIPDDGPYETLGGLIMFELGRMPAVGDSVKVGGAELHVKAMDGLRIDRVRIEENNDDGGAVARDGDTAEAGGEE